jgi:ubiquinone/menaquinone biosynthesis C-methylase UbiE
MPCQRIGSHGLFVVADVANMPLRTRVLRMWFLCIYFSHLPLEGRKKAYAEVFRMLKREAHAVIVNGWNIRL